MSTNVPWFKLALIGTFIGVSAIIGYAASTSLSKIYRSEAENVDSILEQGNLKITSKY